jgi:predicted  nucleic acid-binding Zn-ribbon protein
MRTSLLFSCLLFFVIFNAYAQTEVVVSDDELNKYATAMDSVNELTIQLMDSISLLVKNTTVMSAARYNELSRIVNNKIKLSEAKATAEEIIFVKYIAEYKSKVQTTLT